MGINVRRSSVLTGSCVLLVCLAAVSLGAVSLGAQPVIRPDTANEVTFSTRQAKFVRLLIHASSANQPCLDELEVFGPDGERNMAAADAGAKATASSCLAGYAIHKIEHLNDGQYGNDHSWIAAGLVDEWAQIELPRAMPVSKVALSRDRNGRYGDRVPTEFDVQLSLDGEQWETVKTVVGRALRIVPRRNSGFASYIPNPPPSPFSVRGPRRKPSTESERLAVGPVARSGDRAQLEYAFLAEEHAWLKTYGRADLSPRLVPYNGRVKQFPKHTGDDRLPLPPLAKEPKFDGRLDDAAWAGASRGVARVAHLVEFKEGSKKGSGTVVRSTRGAVPATVPDPFLNPLVETAVMAGHIDESLYLAITTDRLLSGHVAVVSSADGLGGGVLAVEDDHLEFRTYKPDGQLDRSTRVDGALNAELTCFEAKLPLSWFPDCRELGLRVGLGMGGKHTPVYGRAVNFVFAPLAIAELASSPGGTFRVRLAAAADTKITITGNSDLLRHEVVLQPGEVIVISEPASPSETDAPNVGPGPIGRQFDLTVQQQGGEKFGLHLFRYDPLERTLALMAEMAARFEAQGLDVSKERGKLASLREWQVQLNTASVRDRAAERRAFFEARLAKRQLFFRAKELASLEQILFVKRHAFEPSHNYSVLLDSRYRPGGGVFVLQIPRRDGALEPREATLTKLFDSAGGIARNPVANFDLTKVYFGYRPSADGYFHIMEMAPDGSRVRQLTDGPFHDYWPCPVPDGGLAFISTRCRARFLCWRPQAAVLFRMDGDGSGIRPLSYANLTEWGPSVTSDGRIIWQRSEYIDKGADFSHTLWTIRPDGKHPELVFGNDIVQPNGYANGREVPGTSEVLCTLISHFGDLNGPLALVDPSRGRSNPQAITTLTPEVPWPGMWPKEECFRDPVPLARDYFLCSHAPRDQFGLFVIDRYGNRELLYLDPAIGSMCPTPFRVQPMPPVIAGGLADVARSPDLHEQEPGELFLADVYQGIDGRVARGSVKYLRVCQEVRADLEELPGGELRHDHPEFLEWYATPIHKVKGPFGWPSFVAKASLGVVPVEEDGSARFNVPPGKVVYLQALDEDFNEVQRMRSVLQLQPGERRSCIGCHEPRHAAPPASLPLALQHAPKQLEPPPWGAEPFAYEKVVQPVWNKHCIECHDAKDPKKLDFTAKLDTEKVPASYRTLIEQGWVHYLDCGWNSGGNKKAEPLTFGTVKSKLWKVLDTDHHGVTLSTEERRRIKCWTDLNCPLWPDYIRRSERPSGEQNQVSVSD